MKLPYFDLHCDTLYEIYKNPGRKKQLEPGKLTYQPYRQIFAIWTEHGLAPDAAFEQFLAIHKQAALPPGGILAVEGGLLLGQQAERLAILADCQVKVLTLMWKDLCPLGGAWNTEQGLTEFGRQIVSLCGDLGILPDVSHASDNAFYDVAALTPRFIATHSNARAVCPHRRNLTDEMFDIIKNNGGLVGISMCPDHLAEHGKAGLADILKHIEHYMALGGEDTVCFGCDFDGIETTPDGISGPQDLDKVAQALLGLGYTDLQVRKLFYENANRYFTDFLG